MLLGGKVDVTPEKFLELSIRPDPCVEGEHQKRK
jgi:hypothetical protein